MVTRILLIVPLAASLVVLGWAGRRYRQEQARSVEPPAWPAREKDPAAWTPADFSERAATPGEHFNFSTGLTVAGGASGRARVAIHYRSPADCLYAEVGGGEFSLVAVRGGMARSLAFGPLGAPLGTGEHAFELRRRGAMVAAVLDGRILAAGFAESFAGGSAAVGSQGDGFSFVGPKVFEVEPVLFVDDFMRVEGAFSQWRKVTGTWETRGPSKDPNDRRSDIFRPSMSANAFRYSGTGRPAMAVTGQTFWDMYSLAASVRGAPGGQMGLVFGYRDERNYGLFRWSARPNPLESAAGLAELVAVDDGREVVLQRALTGYIPEQWFRAEVTLGWGWAEVCVDGQRLLSAADPRLAGGAAGLWASAEAETLFDDVLVAEAESFQERFTGRNGTWNSWDFLNSAPHLADGREAEGLELEDRSAPSAGADPREGPGGQAVFGSSRWSNCAIRAELLPGKAPCGLLFNYRDAANYSCLRYDPGAGRLALLSVRNGVRNEHDGASVQLDPAMQTFEVRMDRGLVRASVGGRHELFAWQSAGGGRAGLAVWGGRVLARSVSVRMLAEIEPLPVVNPIFATDAEMGTWSSWQGDWASETVGAGADAATIRWHRARFSGDVQLLVEVAGQPRGAGAAGGGELALSVAKSGDKPGNGYTLTLAVPAAGAAAGTGPGAAQGLAGPAKLALVRDNQTAASAEVPAGRIWTLALRKAGPFLVGSVNGSDLITWRDPEPLTGQKVAWKSKGVNVEEDGFRVYCPAVQNETFDRAPADWRVAEGIWEVTNRWQCDPRWSFFSGRPGGRQKKLAALWNKRQLGDDVVLEFFAGIKMDSARGGQYQYARDINCTLSADGKDLASGYSFLFGGFNDDRSSILRSGVEVAKTPPGGNAVIPRTGGIHHQWFYIRAERKGPQLRFTVDGGRRVDLTYTDPQPLTGKRMAIWNWDCGIIFSRVRVSGPDCAELEPLDFVPGSALLAPVKDKSYDFAE
ncbi:MAG TPA: hypothetical protein PK280_00150 [Planctomycetota bacterium]|nr:hypothetical protein [Planctomycetota bacterium]